MQLSNTQIADSSGREVYLMSDEQDSGYWMMNGQDSGLEDT
jgi:hypothetical protein